MVVDQSAFIISPILETDIPEVALVYTLAFYDNPCYDSLFPEYSDDLKYKAFIWYFTKRVSIAKELNWIMLKIQDKQTKQILGCCCAYSPEQDATTWDFVRHGILLWPYYWGFASFQALLHLMDQVKHVPGWELSMMAIHPNFQGKGIGSVLVQQVLLQIKEKKRLNEEIVITFSTQKEINVRFYEKVGFQLVKVDTLTYSHNNKPYPSWNMTMTMK